MKVIHTYKSWIGAVVVGVLLVGAAVGMAQLENEQDGPKNTEGIRHAQQLSSIFREVAKEALPTIVSIRTVGKANELTTEELPFDEDSPFGEMFKNDPQFRRFFQQRRRMPTPRGMGSGFIIDASGIIMTNNHVVQDAEQVTIRLQDGREFTATDVKTDPRTDVAIVRIEADEDLPALKLGDSDASQIGDWVLAVGSPFGLDGTVTAGIISAKGRSQGITQRDDFLQTDAAINPGNSGGPLLNINGEAIGINTAISSRSGGYDGIGFAIPVNMAKWVSRQLIESGEVRRAYLGVGIQPVTTELASQLEVPAGEGAIITGVSPDSPAADADLQSGDVIVELNGEKVLSPKHLQSVVEKLDIDKSYKAVVLRDGKRETLDITMKEMPGTYGIASFDSPQDEESEDDSSAEKESFDDVGLEISELTADVAEQLGVKANVEGVVITSVEPGSPAESKGLQTGYIIEKVGSERVSSPDEFREAMQDVSLEKGILLLVRVPGGGTQFLVLKSN